MYRALRTYPSEATLDDIKLAISSPDLTAYDLYKGWKYFYHDNLQSHICDEWQGNREIFNKKIYRLFIQNPKFNTHSVLISAICNNDIDAARTILSLSSNENIINTCVSWSVSNFPSYMIMIAVESEEMVQIIYQDWRIPEYHDWMEKLLEEDMFWGYSNISRHNFLKIFYQYKILCTQRIAALRLMMSISLPESFYENIKGMKILVW